MEVNKYFFKNTSEIKDCLFNVLEIQKCLGENLKEYTLKLLSHDAQNEIVVCDKDFNLRHIPMKVLFRRNKYNLVDELIIKLKIAIDNDEQIIYVNNHLQTQDTATIW